MTTSFIMIPAYTVTLVYLQQCVYYHFRCIPCIYFTKSVSKCIMQEYSLQDILFPDKFAQNLVKFGEILNPYCPWSVPQKFNKLLYSANIIVGSTTILQVATFGKHYIRNFSFWNCYFHMCYISELHIPPDFHTKR